MITADITEMDELNEKYGLDVLVFADALTDKLMTVKNQEKGMSWREMLIPELLGWAEYVSLGDGERTQNGYGLIGEAAELKEAIRLKLKPEAVQDECLDVAAFALMIWQKMEDAKVNNI